MIRFLGNIEAKTDTKGRVFIPAGFRKQLQAASGYRMQLQQITAPVPHQTNNITHCSFSIE